MSIKASTFASIIANPMNSYRFEVTIPEIDYTQIVESTDYPAQGAHKQVDLWYQGEKVSYPALPDNGGEWSFTIPDSDTGIIKSQFDSFAATTYNQKTGVMTPRVWSTIVVICKNLADEEVFSGILHGAWLKKRDNIQLDASKADGVVKWKYTFYYNWFEDTEVKTPSTVSPKPL